MEIKEMGQNLVNLYNNIHGKNVEYNSHREALVRRALKKTSYDDMMKRLPEMHGTFNKIMVAFAMKATMQSFNAGALVDELMTEIKRRCAEEFNLTVTHEIKVNDEPTVKIEGTLPVEFNKILAFSMKRPVMMTGPAGTGKGYMARQIAKAINGEFFEVNAVQNEYGLTGFVDANSHYVETPFYKAAKLSSEGKKVVFLFDEMDCSDETALKIFNEALEAREFTFPNNEKLEFRNMIILAACNTFGTGANEQYTGRRLDASTLNRFFVVRVNYDKKVELVMAQGDKELVSFIEDFRKATEKAGMKVSVSYRNIDMIASMKGALPLVDVMEAALVKSLDKDDIAILIGSMPERTRYCKYARAMLGENVDWDYSFQVA